MKTELKTIKTKTKEVLKMLSEEKKMSEKEILELKFESSFKLFYKTFDFFNQNWNTTKVTFSEFIFDYLGFATFRDLQSKIKFKNIKSIKDLNKMQIIHFANRINNKRLFAYNKNYLFTYNNIYYVKQDNYMNSK